MGLAYHRAQTERIPQMSDLCELRRTTLPHTLVNSSKEKGRRLSRIRPFSLQNALLTNSTLGIDPAAYAVPSEEGTMAPGRQPLYHEDTAEPRACSVHLVVGQTGWTPTYWWSPCLLRVCPTPRQRNALGYE